MPAARRTDCDNARSTRRQQRRYGVTHILKTNWLKCFRAIFIHHSTPERSKCLQKSTNMSIVVFTASSGRLSLSSRMRCQVQQVGPRIAQLSRKRESQHEHNNEPNSAPEEKITRKRHRGAESVLDGSSKFRSSWNKCNRSSWTNTRPNLRRIKKLGKLNGNLYRLFQPISKRFPYS